MDQAWLKAMSTFPTGRRPSRRRQKTFSNVTHRTGCVLICSQVGAQSEEHRYLACSSLVAQLLPGSMQATALHASSKVRCQSRAGHRRSVFLHFGSTILHGAPSTRVSVQHLQLFGIGDSSGAIGSGAAQHAAPLGSARRAARRCAAWSSTWCSPAARIVCKGHSGSASSSRYSAGTTRGECTYVGTDPSCLFGAAGGN